MCISLLGGAKVSYQARVGRPKFRQVGSMLAHFSLLSASWAHFSRLAAFVAPFGRFFRDLGRSSLDFGAPSWPYVGTHFALDGIFRHAAGIAAKKPCWHSLSVFRFHNAARRYVRSTWNRGSRKNAKFPKFCSILAACCKSRASKFEPKSMKNRMFFGTSILRGFHVLRTYRRAARR